jgi:FixJ family two-component response regulator
MDKKILVVDDEKDFADIIRCLLQKKGFQVTAAYGGTEAIGLVRSESFDMVITDICMPPPDGVEIMKAVRSVNDETEIIVITGYPSVDLAVNSLRDFQVYDFCMKPLTDIPLFFLKIHKAFERQSLRKEKSILLEKLISANRELKQEISRHEKTEKSLRNSEKELHGEKQRLKDINIALKVLLNQREKDKKRLEEKVFFNIQKLILPYLEKLKAGGSDKQQNSLLSIIEDNLNGIAAPLIRGLSPELLQLTPKEIEICNLIRQGRTSKEIAEIFCLSPRTVDTHRNNIRKKIGLDQKSNLRTFLLTSR